MQRENTSSPGWHRILGIAGGVVLGAVFLIAAWAKALDPTAFAGQITNEGLDFLLPAMAVALIALALEVFLGSALILAVRRWWILWPTTLLVAFFLFLTGRSYWRYARGEVQDEGSCGCFGNLVERTPAEAFWQDLLLMVPALLLAYLARPTNHRLPWLRLAATGVLTIAVVVLAWKAPELPLDNLATRLKPGIDPMAICAGSVDDDTRVCMDGVLPEIAEGEHLVVMAELEDGPLGDHVAALNEYHWSGNGPPLWVLTDATSEQLFGFRFSHGPSFELREAPAALLRPLYRTLPRSFLVRDGRVVETFSGLLPLERWVAAAEPAEAGVDSQE